MNIRRHMYAVIPQWVFYNLTTGEPRRCGSCWSSRLKEMQSKSGNASVHSCISVQCAECDAVLAYQTNGYWSPVPETAPKGDE